MTVKTLSENKCFGGVQGIRGWSGPPILVDQGTKDPLLDTQLNPELLKQACTLRNVPLEMRMQEGYDHSYFFIASFIEDHLRFHARHP
jgi:S-formylglutathione hydrolase